MILRNGILSSLRAKGRTALFAALILLMCLSLTLGAGMWAYCSGQLRELDGSYTSIALVEYMGADYPDENAADDFARSALSALDSSAIAAIPGVELWEEEDSTLAHLEGFKRTGDATYSNHAVIEFIQFAERSSWGNLELSEEELPQTFFAMTANKPECRIRTEGLDTGFLPFFYSDGKDTYQVEYSGGRQVSTVFEESELPPDRIVLSTVLMYYKGGAIKVLPFSLTDTVYQYIPEAGLYTCYGEISDGYTAIANDIIYARDLEGIKALILDPNGHDFVPEKGRRYTIHGQFVESGSGHLRFAITDFYEGCEILPWQDTKESEASDIFYEYADYYSRANNFVTVRAGEDTASTEAFHQDIFRLSQGRFPESGEKGVCAVSGDIAARMELELGDSISLSYFSSDQYDRLDVRDSGKAVSLELVGIATAPEGYSGYVWVSDAEGSFGGELYGYQLGRAVLDNASARSAAEAIEALCPEGVQVTLFDQGYSAAAQPLETMRSTATAVTLASALGALAVIFLFAYLFVGRQRETVMVLVSLGTPGAKISLWLLSGAVLISGLASALGAYAGSLTLGKIIALAFSAATELYAVDSRYSESAVGVVREAAGLGETPLWPPLAAFIFIFVLSLIFCRVFLGFSKRQSAPKRGKLFVRVPRGGTSLALRGPVRFALLSARRGGWRSGVVPAAALVLSLLLGILASAAGGWSAQMEALYENAEIQGRAVSTNGRRSTGLVVSTEDARTLWKSGLLEDISVSIGFNYWFGEDMPAFGTSSFAQEARQRWIGRQPEIVALNSLEAAPEFIYSGAPEVTWLSGWDESFLSYPEACAMSLPEEQSFWTLTDSNSLTIEAIPCLMPRSLMERFGLELGDGLHINLRYHINNREYETTRGITVVGSFTQAAGDANIYVPLSFWCDEDWITSQEDLLPSGVRVDMNYKTDLDRDRYIYNMTRFGTCVFTLSEASQLDALRDYLNAKDFTRVDALRSNRTTILLFDSSFVETVGGLGRYISFSELLFPVLFALVAVLGFIISWLMVNSRRMEFAILRGLGAGRGRVFLSFFLEQAFLCLLGCIGAGIILGIAVGLGSWLTALGIFAACYLLGAAFSVLAVGRTKLMSLLSERE